MNKLLLLIITVQTILIIFLLIKISNLSAVKKEYILVKNKFNSILQLVNTKFIFNSFSTINTLCYEDTFKAQLVNSNLSSFIRGIIELLIKDKNVDFKTEYNCLNSYLQIEEIHLKNKLSIEQEINFIDFKIPSYSLNLIVQDFINYSVYLHKVTGKYKISTNLNDNKIIIKQNINSLFLSEIEKNFLLSHEQIQFSLKRISENFHGCVTIDSNIEDGTTVNVEIPVEGKVNEYSGS